MRLTIGKPGLLPSRGLKMKVARLAVMGVAVLAAGGAFMLASKMANKAPEIRDVASNEPQIKLVEVLVASEDISLGTSIKPNMVTWQNWPKESVSNGYIQRSGNPKGLGEEDSAIARAAFFAGEPIRESKLVRSGHGYMSAILPAGKRAIATAISTATGAGGFVLPNDHVDVIMTRRADEDEGEGFITETILENIRVLAIDQSIEEKDGESVVVGETATLQLTPDQAKILTVAQQMADRLALSLRSLEDSGDEETKGAEYLLSGSRGKGRVRLIKFGKRQDVVAAPANVN